MTPIEFICGTLQQLSLWKLMPNVYNGLQKGKEEEVGQGWWWRRTIKWLIRWMSNIASKQKCNMQWKSLKLYSDTHKLSFLCTYSTSSKTGNVHINNTANCTSITVFTKYSVSKIRNLAQTWCQCKPTYNLNNACSHPFHISMFDHTTEACAMNYWRHLEYTHTRLAGLVLVCPSEHANK